MSNTVSDEVVDHGDALEVTFRMFDELEAAHADRGLTFERVGLGAVPVQAYGQVDGGHFYFRYRSDRAALRVGPFDETLEHAVWLRGDQQRKQKIAELTTDGRLFMRRMLERPYPRPQPGAGYLPVRVTASAVREDATGDGLGGFLTGREFAALFTELLGKLSPVPADKQVDSHMVGWLTEGGLWPLPAK